MPICPSQGWLAQRIVASAFARPTRRRADAASKQPRQRDTRKRRRISAKAPCIERAQREGRSSRMTERGTSGSTSNPPAGANVTAGAMTVDVEDYFQVAALSQQIRREDWDSHPCRVERNVDRILGLFSKSWGIGRA